MVAERLNVRARPVMRHVDGDGCCLQARVLRGPPLCTWRALASASKHLVTSANYKVARRDVPSVKPKKNATIILLFALSQTFT